MIEIKHSNTNVPTDDKITVRTKNSCNDCQNVEICKYVEAYQREVSELQKHEFPEIMKMDISCRYHKSNEGIPKVSIRGRNGEKSTFGQRRIMDRISNRVKTEDTKPDNSEEEN